MVESARRTSRSNFQKRGIKDKIDLVMEEIDFITGIKKW